MADVAVYSRRRVLNNRALAVTPEWIREVRTILRASYVMCRDCARGDACEAWRAVNWDDDYFVPRAPSDRVDPRRANAMLGDFLRLEETTPVLDACIELGLVWPCTLEQIAAAYRPLVRSNHPDLGGTTEAIVRINTARDTVRRALEVAP
jgi:hypothetical protein